MIKPEEIPQFTGDLEQLEKDYGALKKDAGKIRSTGADVHTQFQGLSAFYHAPEAEQLFASTKPVSTRSDTFGTDLETVASALSGYAAEVRPLAEKLKSLKSRATTFVDSVKDDQDWQYDGDKVDENNKIRDDVTAAVAAFWAAERTCHNKITALWHGTQMIAGDGSNKSNMYGYNASDLKNAKLPWGDPVEEKHHWYEIGHWVKSFVWDGIVVDGIWGTIKGLGTLVGVNGWDAMGQAWKGLAQLGTALAVSMTPGLQAVFFATPDKYMPSWLRESRNTMKATGKALVAWDEWGKNPARAAGAVTFNVVTTVFTGGEGAAAAGAGKAGAVARAVSVAGKVGKVIDPMTYVMKGAGAGLSKVGDIAKNLKGIGKIDIPTLPDGAVHFPDGSVHLPGGAVHVPHGSVHLPDGRVLQPNGNIADHAGNVETTPIPKEVTPGLPSHWTIQGAADPASAGVSHAMDHGAHGSFSGGLPSAANDGIHGGIPQSVHDAVHGGTSHVPGDGIHGGVPKSFGHGVYGGAQHIPDHGITGGIPHVPDHGITGGVPHVPGHGITGGVPHVPDHGITGGLPHVPGHGITGGIPHGTGDAVSAGGHAGTTPSAWYHDTPTAPAHDVPHPTAHDAPAITHPTPHDTFGGGHTDHGTGHNGAGHDGAGHTGDHSGPHHAGFGHDAADIAGHDGADAAAPGHTGGEAPGHGGAGDPFEYKPSMSADDFKALSDADKHAVAEAELARGTNHVPSDTNGAGLAYGNAYWNDFLDGLSPESRDALRTYSGNDYDLINSHLRFGNDLDPSLKHTIDEMDKVMGARPVPEDIMIVRGTGVDHIKIDGVPIESPTDMMGGTFDDKAFTSTALGKTPPPPFDGKPVWMHLRVPKDTPALWIDHLSKYPGERELLLARGSEYKVTRVFFDETHNKWHLYGEVLPKPKP